MFPHLDNTMWESQIAFIFYFNWNLYAQFEISRVPNSQNFLRLPGSFCIPSRSILFGYQYLSTLTSSLKIDLSAPISFNAQHSQDSSIKIKLSDHGIYRKLPYIMDWSSLTHINLPRAILAGLTRIVPTPSLPSLYEAARFDVHQGVILLLWGIISFHLL